MKLRWMRMQSGADFQQQIGRAPWHMVWHRLWEQTLEQCVLTIIRGWFVR